MNGTNDPRSRRHDDGPVINGPVSHAQFAWGNQSVTQNQQNNTAAAPGYEALAALVADLLRQLPQAGLPDADRADAEAAARDVLDTVNGSGTPEPGRVRRALTMLRGVLAPVATGAVAGTAAGAQDWARQAIEGLSHAL
ncbi:hypothetical protein KUM39_02950 [Streptomyces sp. J2-1]|uniref:hypothetical protein n=1 Tax=Streptomyces corallincola TaxID=2851888 RepID=UPI001C37F1D1|nr:hypothetical protein [Streptomyces corallincola]MBV2353328.1 hypothetical protein [Streptomyces corallincola]